MPLADLMLDNTIISALGWTLVHFLWQGCLIAFVYWFICALAPRHAAGLKYWVGLSGMLFSLLAMLLTFTLFYAPEARFGPHSLAASAVNPFLVLSGKWPDGLAVLESGLEPVLHWVVLVWLLGVAWFSLQVARDSLQIHNLLHRGIVGTEVQLQLALERYKSKLGVQLAVRLAVSTRVMVPMVVGWLRPIILVPASALSRLPQDQLEMILAHELGHIRRFDYLFNILQILIETLLFYHPAITWMSRRVREEREHCCDDLVVRFCGRPATYARALANLELMRSPTLAAAIPANGGNLLMRIRLIAEKTMPAKHSTFAQFALAAVAGLAVALGTQQGYSLSSELNRVAFAAQLQASDVQWKTWGRSREAWSEGITLFAETAHKRQLAVLKIESMSWQHLVEPKFDFGTIASRDVLDAAQWVLDDSQAGEKLQIEPPDSPAQVLSVTPPDMNPALLPGKPVSRHTPAALGVTPQVFKVALHNAPSPALKSLAPSGQYAIKPGKSGIKPLKSRAPNYPWKARKEGIEGFVELEFSVDAEGRVSDVEILDAVPAGIFEEAASKAISRWTFTAPQSSGSRFRQVFDFEMQDAPKLSPRQRACATTGSRTCGLLATGVYVVWVNGTTRSDAGTALN
jgi:bla regulator protein BlaR1